jgi:uncharacterized membrane protein YfcA
MVVEWLALPALSVVAGYVYMRFQRWLEGDADWRDWAIYAALALLGSVSGDLLRHVFFTP